MASASPYRYLYPRAFDRHSLSACARTMFRFASHHTPRLIRPRPPSADGGSVDVSSSDAGDACHASDREGPRLRLRARAFRFAPWSLLAAAAGLGWFPFAAGGCGNVSFETVGASDAGTVRRDAAPVDPIEPGPHLDAGQLPPPSCEKYCQLVMANCTGANAQYASEDECLAFCAHVPLNEVNGGGNTKSAPTVACRQYWADGPAHTQPDVHCLAAGPFGGNTCGSRCTTFCNVLLSACPPDSEHGPYENSPDCANACAGFPYRDAGAGGGGEGPDGPNHGDSLNCRLHWLRAATTDPTTCEFLGLTSEPCSD